METNIFRSLLAVSLVSLTFLTSVGFAYEAHAQTVITVDDEESCTSLPVLGGTAIWTEANSCLIPEEATLQIEDEEVLDLRVGFTSAGRIDNLQGGAIDIAADKSLVIYIGALNNFGTIDIRAGARLNVAEAFFYNAPNGIVNNYGEFAGTSDGPQFTNEGTINNQETGRIRIHSEMRLLNNPQGVINNHGFMQINEAGIVNNGTLNNYASASLHCSGEAGGCFFDTHTSPRNGTLYNFGALNITSSFDTVHILETISNHGEIRIINEVFEHRSYDVVNDVTILNQPSGVIENFARFNNLGVIDNQGEISNHCGTFTNSGTFTGNPVNNAGNDNSQPLVSITSIIDVEDASPGSRIRIAGTASDSGDGCGVEIVEVKVKDPVTFELFRSYQISDPIASDDWSTWTRDFIFEEEREYAIVARATDLTGNQNWYLTTFRVEFGSEVDRSRPLVEITSQDENIVTITGPASGVTLDLEGTSSDIGRGVARVEVKINDPRTLQVLSGYTPATASGPAGEDDYSTWEKQLTFDEEGHYRVTARATDESGNRYWSHVFVVVEFTNEPL